MEDQRAALGCVSYGEQKGNPVWFSRKYFSELSELEGDQGGRKVLKKYEEETIYFSVEEARELLDIDTLSNIGFTP